MTDSDLCLPHPENAQSPRLSAVSGLQKKMVCPAMDEHQKQVQNEYHSRCSFNSYSNDGLQWILIIFFDFQNFSVINSLGLPKIAWHLSASTDAKITARD